ncbi:deoxyhypusine synthase family protein [Pajaroellobacter abortibovis]|uniref:Uncharacterized protein n=1 Tax=Pajaroellobacter abortibovis TaxID=1882918 RepID=A0A1L6MZ60_9BACT|nr:deoxyhypusine synthase family protein [Pajaroellobacter abortibovis]APS00796.1 hypothetical protein BCY86_08975 [Pajaroellobacter abortibovis]
MTKFEFYQLLDERIAELEEALSVPFPSLLSTAYRHKIQIFVGVAQDGSIFLNVIKLRRQLEGSFRLEIDIQSDVCEEAAMQYHCSYVLQCKMAVWILGDGVPKNYTLQGEPFLDQVPGILSHSFDIDVQFCVDPVGGDALSSCPSGEGHTLGKVSSGQCGVRLCLRSCGCNGGIPWVTYALLSDPSLRRPSQKLFDIREQTVGWLQQEVETRRQLPVPNPAPPVANPTSK